MERDVTIKSVRIADHYDEVAAMMLELHVHEHSLFDKTAAWADIEAGYMRHVIDTQANSEGTCLIAYIAGKPVGFIFGYVEEQDDSRIEVYMGKELYVSDGFVTKELRGQGIYRLLNAELERIYISQGVKRICRHTLINNTRARKFLEEQGYTVTRLLYEKWL
jgi:ribosomal protein S18 acetylase RimI-like enzyme